MPFSADGSVYVLPPPALPSVAVAGTRQYFPVRRIYCVGRNYAEHAREMGGDPSREAPFFFMKPADAIVADGGVVPIRHTPQTSITKPSWSLPLAAMVPISPSNKPRPLSSAMRLGWI